ncbi:hypothetical protein BASA83_004497 [Batrachochytrium salamandrivorans]|nr:hypothetical protein BASA83_004497 [Batrachochytrium salamandrivorans]
MRVSAAIAVLAITAPLTSVVFAHPNPLPAVVDGALANTNFLADMPPIQKRSQESAISIRILFSSASSFVMVLYNKNTKYNK